MIKQNKIKLVNFIKVIGHEGLHELYVIDGKAQVLSEQCPEAEVIDCTDCIIAPGFIDPQVNGFRKCDFWAMPSFDEIDEMRKDLASSGTVGFLPTIITNSKEKVIQSIVHINEYLKQCSDTGGAKILGIHVEGIFITKYGVHKEKYANSELTPANLDPYLLDNVLLFTIAPELDKGGIAIKHLKDSNILISAGHTNGTYKEGKKAIEEYGVDLATHMFNAMKGISEFSHRDFNSLNTDALKQKLENDKYIDENKDGIMLSLLKSKSVIAMVIADGVHVSDEAIRVLSNYKNNENFALVSDLVTKQFYEKQKVKGSLGGGQSTLDKCIRNIINWNVRDTEEALISASKPIAQKINKIIKSTYGEIVLDNEASLVLWNTKLNEVKGTIIGLNTFINN